MPVTIYHNPRCSKSRETLALLEEHGVKPVVVEYLETPPDAATLARILQQLGLAARDLIRTSEPAFQALELSDPSRSEAELIDAMVRHPELIQRPIVVANGKARLGRPPEAVLEIVG